MSGGCDVLLVELIVVDRFHRAILFPFVQGWLREQGLATHWVRFGLRADARLHADDANVELPAEDRPLLRDIVERLRPARILLSHPPSAATLECLGAGARVAVLADGPWARTAAGSGYDAVRPSVSELARYAAIPATEERHLIAESTPDFGWEPGNPAALEAPSLPFLVCGEECTWSRGFASNPLLKDLDLQGCVRTGGCAFCTRDPNEGRWPVEPVELLRRQLRALARTHRKADRLVIRAQGEPVLHHVTDLAASLREAGLAPADILLDARADALLRRRGELRQALAALQGSGHVLHLGLVGIESFVDDELVLFNKGTTWRQNLAAIQTLFELEHEFPMGFSFREHGGLSLILLTPWTRPEDLSLNLAIIRRCGLGSVCGKALTGRLRLYPELPLYRLAVRDGLLAAAPYSDPLLDTARRNFYAEETAWRHQAPVLETASRVMLRMQAQGRDPEDSIQSALLALRDAEPASRDLLGLAEALVDAAIDAPEQTSPEALLAHAGELLLQGAHPGLTDTAFEGGLNPGLLAFQLGLKPVVRFENAAAPDMPEARRELDETRALSQTRTAPDARQELFFGREQAEIVRAIELTDRMDQTGDEAAWSEAAREVGVLLGYPACCTSSFGRLPAALRESYTWMHVALRLRTPGPVDPLLNPNTAVVSWVPCSLQCAGTLQFARALAQGWAERRGPEVAERLKTVSESPWLMLMDYQSVALRLEVDGEPTSRFRFRASQHPRQHPLLARVTEADELVVEEQRLLALRAGRVHASLSGRAFLWWHGAAIQADFWGAMLALRFSHRERAAGGADAGSGTVSQRLEALARKVLSAPGAPASFAGHVVADMHARHHDRLTVTLAGPQGRLELLVAPRRMAPKAFAFAGPVAVMLPVGAAIRSAEQERAVRQFVLALAKGMIELARSRATRDVVEEVSKQSRER